MQAFGDLRRDGLDVLVAVLLAQYDQHVGAAIVEGLDPEFVDLLVPHHLLHVLVDGGPQDLDIGQVGEHERLPDDLADLGELYLGDVHVEAGPQSAAHRYVGAGPLPRLRKSGIRHVLGLEECAVGHDQAAYPHTFDLLLLQQGPDLLLDGLIGPDVGDEAEQDDQVDHSLDGEQAHEHFAGTVPQVCDVSRGRPKLHELRAAVGRSDEENAQDAQDEGGQRNEGCESGHGQSSPSNRLRSRAHRVTRWSTASAMNETHRPSTTPLPMLVSERALKIC